MKNHSNKNQKSFKENIKGVISVCAIFLSVLFITFVFFPHDTQDKNESEFIARQLSISVREKGFLDFLNPPVQSSPPATPAPVSAPAAKSSPKPTLIPTPIKEKKKESVSSAAPAEKVDLPPLKTDGIPEELFELPIDEHQDAGKMEDIKKEVLGSLNSKDDVIRLDGGPDQKLDTDNFKDLIKKASSKENVGASLNMLKSVVDEQKTKEGEEPKDLVNEEMLIEEAKEIIESGKKSLYNRITEGYLRLNMAYFEYEERHPKIQAARQYFFEELSPVTRKGILIGIVFMIYVSYCLPLMWICQHFQTKRYWKAWIPFVQEWHVVKMAGHSSYFLCLYLIPLVSLILPIYLWYRIAHDLGKEEKVALCMIMPGFNIMALWYFAYYRKKISHDIFIKSEEKEPELALDEG